MNKTEVNKNKPLCLTVSTLDMSKIAMYEYWYDYIKTKYDDKGKLCYTDKDSFIIHIKLEDIHPDISVDVEKKLIHQTMKLTDHYP